jgi:hypothetical protein
MELGGLLQGKAKGKEDRMTESTEHSLSLRLSRSHKFPGGKEGLLALAMVYTLHQQEPWGPMVHGWGEYSSQTEDPATHGNLLFICDGLVAAVTDPHFKLKAHQGDGGALGAALATDGLPTLAAVVLGRERKQRLLWLHDALLTIR